MIDRGTLDRLAETVSHGNIGHAETLYLQDIILSTISRETVDELVFKGGTALAKCYQLDRFSEDLDFTAREGADPSAVVSKAVRDLNNYGATVVEQSSEESEASIHSRLAIQGPLFTGERRSMAYVRIEVNTRSSVTTVVTRRYTSPFPDIPSFELAVLDEAEILAEKIRALVTRHEPRDLYDAYHLISKGVAIDAGLVQDKLTYYDLEFDRMEVLEEASSLESNWADLATLTYSRLPPYETALETLEQALAG